MSSRPTEGLVVGVAPVLQSAARTTTRPSSSPLVRTRSMSGTLAPSCSTRSIRPSHRGPPLPDRTHWLFQVRSTMPNQGATSWRHSWSLLSKKSEALQAIGDVRIRCQRRTFASGLTDPTIIIPLGPQVQVEVVNADQAMAHGFVVADQGTEERGNADDERNACVLWTGPLVLRRPTSAGTHAGMASFFRRGHLQLLLPRSRLRQGRDARHVRRPIGLLSQPHLAPMHRSPRESWGAAPGQLTVSTDPGIARNVGQRRPRCPDDDGCVRAAWPGAAGDDDDRVVPRWQAQAVAPGAAAPGRAHRGATTVACVHRRWEGARAVLAGPLDRAGRTGCDIPVGTACGAGLRLGPGTGTVPERPGGSTARPQRCSEHPTKERSRPAHLPGAMAHNERPQAVAPR